MTARPAALVLASALLPLACASPSADAPPLAASQPAPTIAEPTYAGSALGEEACGLEPPPLLTPANGAVVSGQVLLSAPLLEGPCFIAATVVFTVRNANGATVFRGCDNDIPARRTWDASTAKNGAYRISAQRACNCDACAEASHVDVVLANP